MEISGGRAPDDGAVGEERSSGPGRRWGRAAAAAGVVVALAASGAAWLAASQARTPEQRAASAAAPPRSDVTVPAEPGPLVDRGTWDGTLTRSSSLVVRGPESGGGAARQVVTRLSLKPGAKLANGSPAAEISGRPLFLLEGAFPAYRDLAEGMRGPDVRQLQQALRQLYGTPATGTFDGRTARDLQRLYRSAGYQPLPTSGCGAAPGDGTDARTGGSGAGGSGSAGSGSGESGSGGSGTGGSDSGGSTTAGSATAGSGTGGSGAGGSGTGGPGATSAPEGSPGPAVPPPPAPRAVVTLPMSEVVFLDALPATVGEVSGRVGANASDPLFTVTGGRWLIKVPVPDTALPAFTSLPRGTRAKITGDRLGGGALQGSYESVSTGSPRHAYFGVTGTVSDTALGSPVTVDAVRRSSSPDSLIVPVSALWTDPAGLVSVTVVQGDRRRHVPVDVGLTVGGRAAVTGTDPALAKGARLLVGYAYREAGLG
ncbi:peptidoglycan-binding domain-containing protein [Streptomyces sp. NPDC047971]|uniref:peptidoglycan-binding domain-containing protein n=1 Tax=Streptomyces sp. NPDC047971 TaxID=3154499 RepID=UPI0033D6D1B0